VQVEVPLGDDNGASPRASTTAPDGGSVASAPANIVQKSELVHPEEGQKELASIQTSEGAGVVEF